MVLPTRSQTESVYQFRHRRESRDGRKPGARQGVLKSVRS